MNLTLLALDRAPSSMRMARVASPAACPAVRPPAARPPGVWPPGVRPPGVGIQRSLPLSVLGVAGLQRAAGNQAVAQLLTAGRARSVTASSAEQRVAVQRDPSTEDCSDEREQTVLTSHFAAQRFLRAAIAATEPRLADLTAGVADAVRYWFNIDRDEPSTAFEHGRDYLRVQTALRSIEGPSQDASYECGSLICDYNPFADSPTAMSLGDIVLCDPWFASNDDDRAGILVHEWSHKFGEGVARAIETYEWHADWSGMSSVRRVTMPDAYEGFAKEMATGKR